MTTFTLSSTSIAMDFISEGGALSAGPGDAPPPAEAKVSLVPPSGGQSIGCWPRATAATACGQRARWLARVPARPPSRPPARP